MIDIRHYSKIAELRDAIDRAQEELAQHQFSEKNFIKLKKAIQDLDDYKVKIGSKE